MFPLIPITLALACGVWFFIVGSLAQRRLWVRAVLAVCGIVAFFVAFGIIGALERTVFQEAFLRLLARYRDPTVALGHTLLAGVVTFLAGLVLWAGVRPSLPEGAPSDDGTDRVRYGCPHCGVGLESDRSMVGREDACPSCGKASVVPAVSSSTPPRRTPWVAVVLLLIVSVTLGALAIYVNDTGRPYLVAVHGRWIDLSDPVDYAKYQEFVQKVIQAEATGPQIAMALQLSLAEGREALRRASRRRAIVWGLAIAAGVAMVAATGVGVRAARLAKSTKQTHSIAALLCCTFGLLFVCGCYSPGDPGFVPRSAQDYFLRGRAHQDHMRVNEAISEFTQAIAMEPNYVDAYAFRAMCHLSKDVDRAVADFDRAVSLCPDDEKLYRWRALAHNTYEDADKALADYDKAIAVGGSKGDLGFLYHQKAQFLESVGRTGEAIAAYEACLTQPAPPPPPIQKRTADDEFRYWAPKVVLHGLLAFVVDQRPREVRGTPVPYAKMTPGIREKIIQLKEVQAALSSGEPPAITKGMPAHLVVGIVRATKRVLHADEKAVVALDRQARSCPLVLTLYLLSDGRLASARQCVVETLPVNPSRETLLPLRELSAMSRDQLRRTVQEADQIIYEDPERILTVGYYPSRKCAAVKFFDFKDNRLQRLGASARLIPRGAHSGPVTQKGG